uniref:Coiled-coil domain containing 51 n=1 Tax=Hydatigena taeniaeformis TaxID=6205 RepID=A0A0R3WVE0_HYDTA
LFDVQKKRGDVNKQLDVVSRADDSFLSLVTKEHELAREENQLASQHHEADLVERATYEKFTSLLRYLHVEERNYDTRMRQWALVGSLVIGFTSAFVTWLRFRTPKFQDLRDSVEKVRDVYTSQDDFRESVEKLQEVHSCQRNKAGEEVQPVGPPFPIKTSVVNSEKSGFETKIIYAASACVLFCAIYFLSR